MINDLAQKASALRRVLNLTQGHIATNLGVSQETISKWERGTKTIPPHRIKDLAHTLGCSQQELQELTLGDLISKIAPLPLTGITIP